MHSAKFKAALLMCLFIQGCATYKSYSGPEKVDGEIAILEGYWHYYLVMVRIAKIVSVDGTPIIAASGDITRVMLDPGPHSIGLQFGSAFGEVGTSAACTFEWPFEKGHLYRIKSFSLGASETGVPIEIETRFGNSVTTRSIACSGRR